MKIEVARIKDDPIALQSSVFAQDWGLDNYDVKLKGAITLACVFRRLGDEIMVDAQVNYSRAAVCARCLTEVNDKVTTDFSLSYNALELGEELTVDDDVREQILLNLPMRFLCSKDCKGICAGCGANLNTEKCSCGPQKSNEIKINI